VGGDIGGIDADTGRIIATALATNDVDDGWQVSRLLDRVAAPLASFTGDGAYDQEGVDVSVAERHPEAAATVPPRSTAVASETAEIEPTQRDCHLQLIARKPRSGWRKAPGYHRRAKVEAAIGRYNQVIGDGMRSRRDCRRATKMAIAVRALNHMLEFGSPNYVRIT